LYRGPKRRRYPVGAWIYIHCRIRSERSNDSGLFYLLLFSHTTPVFTTIKHGRLKCNHFGYQGVSVEWTINCTGDLSEGDIRLAHGYIYIVGYAVKGLFYLLLFSHTTPVFTTIKHGRLKCNHFGYQGVIRGSSCAWLRYLHTLPTYVHM
jgi:hypothetical protein